MIGYKLKRLCEQHGPDTTVKFFSEAISAKKLDPYKIRLPELAEAFLGRDYLRAEAKLRAIALKQVNVLEAAEAVDSSAFAAITGQLLVTVIKDKYESVDFVTDRLYRTISNPAGNLREFKIPYLSDIPNDPSKLAQAEPYPFAQFSGNYLTLPAPEKFGLICAVTMEMLLSDLTGQAQDSAASVGRSMGYNREVRRLRPVLGLTNPYVWNGNTLNTYVSTPNVGNYVNKLLSNTLTNFNHINAVEQLFWNAADPVTGRLINVRPRQILCMPEKRYALANVLKATTVRSGNVSAAPGDQLEAPNPLDSQYEVITSPLARLLLINEGGLAPSVAAERLYFGDFPRAFVYREVYPMRTEEAPVNNPLMFNQDITLAVRVSEFGVAGIYDPRYAAMSTAEAS